MSTKLEDPRNLSGAVAEIIETAERVSGLRAEQAVSLALDTLRRERYDLELHVKDVVRRQREELDLKPLLRECGIPGQSA